MKQGPGCLASRQGLSYWELVAFPTSFLSSQGTSVADCPRDPLSLFAERVFDGFGDAGRRGGHLQHSAAWGRCRLGGGQRNAFAVCVSLDASQIPHRRFGGVVVGWHPLICASAPSYPPLLSAAPPCVF